MTFEELLEQLEKTSRTTTDKGTKFEEVIAAYLRTAPEFADQFDGVYAWQDWPERGNQHDHGIDLVAVLLGRRIVDPLRSLEASRGRLGAGADPRPAKPGRRRAR